MVASLAAMFLCGGAFAKEYAEDPVAVFLQGQKGKVWDKVKEAHKADWATQGVEALKALAGGEAYAPEAVLVALMMACNGNEAAQKYILQEAETDSSLAGALSEMGCIFLDYRKCIPALINRLETTGGYADYFRGVAGTALANLTGVYMEPDLRRWQKWWDQNKDKFKPDNKVDLDRFRYEIKNGTLTSTLVFHEVGRDDRFMELLIDFNKTAKKFSGERWPLGDAAAAIGKGDFDKARDIAKAALKDWPADIYAMYIAASMALEAGDVKGAQADFEEIAALDSQMKSAAFLAAYCKELLAANKKPGEIEILLKVYRALPADATARGWYVPDAYLFSRAFDLPQETIVEFARKNVDKPTLLAGALLMLQDAAIRRDLVKAGLEKNPNDELLHMLRLQFLLESGTKENLKDINAEIDAVAKINPDNALPDCLKVFLGMEDNGVNVYADNNVAPLTAAELKAIMAAAEKKRLTALTARKQDALLAACKAMGGPVWRTRALSTLTEGMVSEPQWILNLIAIKTAVNIRGAAAAGEIEKAQAIYKTLEALSFKIASEDSSLTNATLGQIIMNHADTGMANGYTAAGKQKEADEYLDRLKKRETGSGISAVQVDPYRWLRKICAPKIMEAISDAMLSDERNFYRKYPDPSATEKEE